MKIGIDCRLWNETGVGRYVRNLVNELQNVDNKNDYVLFALSKDQENIRYKISNIKNEKWRMVTADFRWHTIEEQLRFPQVINRENLDLMHFPYISVPVFYNKPFVVTIHDLIPFHFQTGEASRLPLPLYELKVMGYKFVISSAAKKARKIITVSSATQKEIVNYLEVLEEKVCVTYEGIDNEVTNKISKKPQTGECFLYVGNAYPHKNLERFLEAFNKLCHVEITEGYYNIKLDLVGKEDYFYKRLRKRVHEMGLSDRVSFLENVTDEELSSLYRNAKALVMPSLMEGFGLPALEAMANGCLVLASNIPALKEVCGDAAIYFDPYDVDDLTRKIKEIYYDNADRYSKKIKIGLERSKEFSWEKMAKETLKIYESCLSL